VVSGSGADRYALDLGFSATGRVICCGALCTVRSTASRPKVAVLLGTNDIGWLQRTATDTVACIDALVAELHLRLPATKILLVGLLPRRPRPGARPATAEIILPWRLATVTAKCPTWPLRISPRRFSSTACWLPLVQRSQQVQSEPALHSSPGGQDRTAAALEPTLSELVGDVRHDR
jgi:lysophospholipase L1-like esterase